MKTTVPSYTSFTKVILVLAFLATGLVTRAQSGPGGGSGSGHQTTPELVFKNPTLESGTALADNAVYRFKSVTNNVDALVKITGRSSSLVKVTNIDMPGTGYQNAFQPQITYNDGNASAFKNWWMDFDISFVNKSSGAAVSVSDFKVTGIDIDGDGSKLNEYVSFYNASSYVLENNSQLSVSNLLATILGLLIPGREFDGPTTNYVDIDVTATRVMTTVNYVNKSNFRMRAGAQTGNTSSSAAERQYSFWFKGFTYNTPVQATLPIKLVSFNAMLNNAKVDLKWITAEEKNVSHFSIEKSLDGKTYTEAGIVFAYGNSNETLTYNFSDNSINPSKPSVVYYRLRSIDIDGKSQVSEVRVIRIGKQNELTAKILAYPNPVVNEVRVTIPNSWQGKKVTFEVMNLTGQMIERRETGTGSQTETINLSKVAPGNYMVRVTCNGEIAMQKVVKQ